jgi:hypothetical protein
MSCVVTITKARLNFSSTDHSGALVVPLVVVLLLLPPPPPLPKITGTNRLGWQLLCRRSFVINKQLANRRPYGSSSSLHLLLCYGKSCVRVCLEIAVSLCKPS